MEENTRITKIVVGKEDELTDIVSGILEAQTSRVILTFAEESDLLISPINISVLLETAKDEEKVLIAQIIKNPTGVRNCNIAGLVSTDSPNNPTEELWQEAESKPVEPPKEIPMREEVVETQPSGAQEKTNFEKRINDAILKSKEDYTKKQETKTLDQDGVLISVGEDLPIEETENKEEEFKPDFSKKDFNNLKPLPQHVETVKVSRPKASFNIKDFFKKLLPQIKNSEVNPVIKPTPRFRKLLPVILISVLIVSALVAVIYYVTVPLVKIHIYVEAKDVSIEKLFTGDVNIKEIDFSALKIPIKTESVEKDRSTTITATGKAYRGEKASGTITLTYPKAGDCTGVAAIALATGTVVTSSDGKSYTLDSDTSVACNGSSTVTIHAVEIGEEYNSSQSFFTVAGYSSSDLFGLKSGGEFSGGTKEEYSVLSLTDVNTAVDSLKQTAVSEAEAELNAKNGEWTIITDSIKSETPAANIVTDVAVGAAATQANLSIKVISTATFYYNNGFDEGVAAMLTNEAQQKNLFETDQSFNLVLGEEIDKEITVVQNNSNGVIIKLVASGSVKPDVDKEQIIKDLKTMKWSEGTAYLDGIKYSDQATKYEFSPINFPKFLYHFPTRQGGIMIEVVSI